MSKRRPTVRPGELHIYYGKESRGEPCDLIFHGGDGTSRRDRAYLHWALGCERPPALSGQLWDQSFFKELDSRGYDLSTLRFYIRKKNEEKGDGGG